MAHKPKRTEAFILDTANPIRSISCSHFKAASVAWQGAVAGNKVRTELGVAGMNGKTVWSVWRDQMAEEIETIDGDITGSMNIDIDVASAHSLRLSLIEGAGPVEFAVSLDTDFN